MWYDILVMFKKLWSVCLRFLCSMHKGQHLKITVTLSAKSQSGSWGFKIMLCLLIKRDDAPMVAHCRQIIKWMIECKQATKKNRNKQRKTEARDESWAVVLPNLELISVCREKWKDANENLWQAQWNQLQRRKFHLLLEIRSWPECMLIFVLQNKENPLALFWNQSHDLLLEARKLE